MQTALSLAVLLGAMLQLQGCGGGDTTTATPPVATTTAAPTPAAVADKVIKGSFAMAGLTAAEANTPAMKTAIAAGLKKTIPGLAAIPGAEVEITKITDVARRLQAARRLSGGIKCEYEITIPGAIGAAAMASVETAVETAETAIKAAADTLLTNIKEAIAASADIPADIKEKAKTATIDKDSFVAEAPVVATTTTTPAPSGNSTASGERRLSFSFVTSDEPLIL